MAGTDSFVQVAIDGAGKRIRNFLNNIAGNDVYQQVVTLAKSDGQVMDDPSRSSVTQPVSGTFFQATQPVSAAALPLPTGAATEATLATRTKPADQQHAIIDSGALTVSNFPTSLSSPSAQSATLDDVLLEMRAVRMGLELMLDQYGAGVKLLEVANAG